MLPVVDDRLAVSQQAFDDFVRRHALLAAIRHVEDNQDMTESYLMVDPMGRFFQNAAGAPTKGYRYSLPILEAGAPAAFAGMRFPRRSSFSDPWRRPRRPNDFLLVQLCAPVLRYRAGSVHSKIPPANTALQRRRLPV
jgi:hypothetical protein